jgi:hypothetical protein
VVNEGLNCGKKDINPKKHPEKTGAIGKKKANTCRRELPPLTRRIISNQLIYKALFRPGFLLDTPFHRPYYAARKF